MAATHYSLADQLVDPSSLSSVPVSRLTDDEQRVLGIKDFHQVRGNEAQTMQAVQRLVIRMTAHDLTPFAIQHELACLGQTINILRIKAIVENPLVQSQVQRIRQEFQPDLPPDEETQLALAAPDCIKLMHEIVKNPFLVVNYGQGEQIIPIAPGDRLFAAKQLLDRFGKTAPVSKRNTRIEHKGLFPPEAMHEIKSNHAKALANAATGVED